MSNFVWPKNPSFEFVNGVDTPDANNQLTVRFTVYDRKGNEYHYTRKQNACIAYDGNFDVFTTANWINQNLITCDNQVKRGILTEASTDEALAAVQAEAAKKAEEAPASQEAAPTSTDTTAGTAPATTDTTTASVG